MFRLLYRSGLFNFSRCIVYWVSQARMPRFNFRIGLALGVSYWVVLHVCAYFLLSAFVLNMFALPLSQMPYCYLNSNCARQVAWLLPTLAHFETSIRHKRRNRNILNTNRWNDLAGSISVGWALVRTGHIIQAIWRTFTNGSLPKDSNAIKPTYII